MTPAPHGASRGRRTPGRTAAAAGAPRRRHRVAAPRRRDPARVRARRVAARLLLISRGRAVPATLGGVSPRSCAPARATSRSRTWSGSASSTGASSASIAGCSCRGRKPRSSRAPPLTWLRVGVRRGGAGCSTSCTGSGCLAVTIALEVAGCGGPRDRPLAPRRSTSRATNVARLARGPRRRCGAGDLFERGRRRGAVRPRSCRTRRTWRGARSPRWTGRSGIGSRSRLALRRGSADRPRRICAGQPAVSRADGAIMLEVGSGGAEVAERRAAGSFRARAS